MLSFKRIVSRVWKFAGFGVLLLALFVAPLVLSCSNPSNGDDSEIHEPPVGTWSSQYGDSYTITGNFLSYDDGFGGGYAGDIRRITYFNATSGVIIIEYTADNKPVYYQSGHYGDAGYIIPLPGNFEGVYFKELTPTSIKLANAVNSDYSPCEVATLEAAINKFTLDNGEGVYVFTFGDYAK